jgi:hypothetical protein
MTFITHRFWVSVVSDVRERVQDLGSPLCFMLRRSSLVELECVSVLHGTCLQCAEFFFIHQHVQPCLSKNPKYTFNTIKSSLTLAYNKLQTFHVYLLIHVSVGNVFFSYLAILASCFKIIFAKLELHLPLIAAKSDPDSKITIF